MLDLKFVRENPGDTIFNAITGILDNILSGDLFKQIGGSLLGSFDIEMIAAVYSIFFPVDIRCV